jgi:hypothetical protein
MRPRREITFPEVIDALDRLGFKPRRSGPGVLAFCPAHADKRHPSLSVSPGERRPVVCKCHARGCSYASIMQALGLWIYSGSSAPPPNRRTYESATRRRKPAAVWKDLRTAAEGMARLMGGTLASVHPYHDPQGREVRAVARFETLEGKVYRQYHRVPGGWSPGAGGDTAPLYDLPAVLKADTVVVVEGEKCADAMIRFLGDPAAYGIAITTSISGAESSKRTDWTPLAGKRVVVLPDRDKAGRKYASRILASTRRLGRGTVAAVATIPFPALWFGEPVRAGTDIADAIADPDGLGVIRHEWEDDCRREWILGLVRDAFDPGRSAPSVLSEARRWLCERLAGGPVAARQLVAEAAALGISERTLRQAKADAGIPAVRTAAK